MKVVQAWQEAADRRMAEVQIRRVFSDIHKSAHGRRIESASVRDYAEKWVVGKEREVKRLS